MFEDIEVPAAPALPEKPEVPAVVPSKPKRKSYYIPVAERAAARKASAVQQKAEKAVRSAGIASNAPKRATVAKAAKKIAKPVAEKSSSSGEAVCSICHKPLSNHVSVGNGMGAICSSKIKLLPKGTTLEDHYASITLDEAPDGFIKLRDALEKLKAKGISVYRVVQAMGGDRMLRPPLNDNFKVVFVAGTRYINGACLKNWKDLEKV
jgi:hypothetical protein